LAAVAVVPAAIAAQEPRVFDGAPAASWIALRGVPGDSFTVFHAGRSISPQIFTPGAT
jgi:hypothetical protein